MADTKLKCLRVLDILNETDSNNSLTIAQISEKWVLFDSATIIKPTKPCLNCR